MIQETPTLPQRSPEKPVLQPKDGDGAAAATPKNSAAQLTAVPARNGKKACILSSVRLATEHRMLRKEGGSLVRAGYEVSIIAPHPQDDEISGISIKAVPKFTSRMSRMLRTPWHIYREAVRQNADVYHLQNIELIPVGWLLKLHGKRILYDVREDMPADLRDKYYIPRWARGPVALTADIAEKVSARVLDGVVAATPHIGTRFPAKKTVVVQNFPILDEEFPPSVPYLQREPLAIYIGSISPVRGLPELIDAVGELPEHMFVRLAIGGEFDPPELEQQVRQSRGWKRVEYLGWQNRNGLLSLLTRARIGVIPFLPAENHILAQPIKLFEYMLAGLPIVATDLKRQAEIIRGARCGILVPPGNPKAMADAIQWLLENPQEAQMMGQRGREAALSTYNWGTQEQLLLEMYRRACS